MKFSDDWFTRNIDTLRTVVLPLLPASPEWLEIGSYEGRSTCWVLDNVPGVSITCVDPYGEWGERGGDAALERFNENVRGRAVLVQHKSQDILRVMKRGFFDVAYIDGDHEAKGVLEDFVGVWGVTKVGGIIILDDYDWQHPHGLLPPKPAIDAVLEIYGSRITVLQKGWQVILRKDRE